MVADAHLAVRAAVSHKSTGALGRNGLLLGCGGDVCDRGALKIVGALAVLRVHMLATLDIACCHADELAVLDDILTRSDIDARNLVEEGDILSRNERGEAALVRGIADLIAGLKRVDCDDDIVLVINKDRVSALLHALRHPISLVDGRPPPPSCLGAVRICERHSVFLLLRVALLALRGVSLVNGLFLTVNGVRNHEQKDDRALRWLKMTKEFE